MVGVALEATQPDDAEQRSTSKGRRRRRELVAAAADLLVEGGFEAVRHRAVAHRAGAPLAATTYYFESLDELRERAVDHGGARDIEALRTRLDPPDGSTLGAGETADRLVDLLMGAASTCDRLAVLARYERFLAPVRYPRLQPVRADLREQYRNLVAEFLRRAGRPISEAGLTCLISIVDGAVLAAVIDADGDPREHARRNLTGLIDLIAPVSDLADPAAPTPTSAADKAPAPDDMPERR